MVRLSANLNGDQGMLRSTLLRFATSDKIGSRPSYRILHNVRQTSRKHNTDSEPKDCDVDLMKTGLKYNSPQDEYA